MSTPPIKFPSNYAPGLAVSFASPTGAIVVSPENPLPIAIAAVSPASGAPLTGSASTSGMAGPFELKPSRAVILVLSGTWAGSVRVLRSTDGGATKRPLTVAGGAWALFTANACEPVWEESEAGASLWLDITLASGSVSYRMAQ